MNARNVVVEAFKKEIMVSIDAYGIKKTVEMYGNTDPFAYIDCSVDLEQFLEQLLTEEE